MADNPFAEPIKNKKMRAVAMIPARFGATRFPGKLMADLRGKSIIVHTYQSTVATGLFDEVFVVTDSPNIKEEIERYNGKVIMSRKQHECGTDRIAEAAENMDVDIIVNVQGDTPFVHKESLKQLLAVFDDDDAQVIDLASIMRHITDWKDISDPNFVKVVVDLQNFALYFSRSPIPYPRDKDLTTKYYEHIGVYAFRKSALMDFYRLDARILENTEKVECIRFLEYGKKIKMIETNFLGIEIDTPEDLIRADNLFDDLANL